MTKVLEIDFEKEEALTEQANLKEEEERESMMSLQIQLP
jgi:hypothetical protein